MQLSTTKCSRSLSSANASQSSFRVRSCTSKCTSTFNCLKYLKYWNGMSASPPNFADACSATMSGLIDLVESFDTLSAHIMHLEYQAAITLVPRGETKNFLNRTRPIESAALRSAMVLASPSPSRHLYLARQPLCAIGSLSPSNISSGDDDRVVTVAFEKQEVRILFLHVARLQHQPRLSGTK